MNIEYKQDVTKDADGQSRLNDGLGVTECNECHNFPNYGVYNTGINSRQYFVRIGEIGRCPTCGGYGDLPENSQIKQH
ncbi:MAG: hypothetical protein WC648_04720 [Candidatus Paceibacterota bacterium]|jgi:hypothetical protein